MKNIFKKIIVPVVAGSMAFNGLNAEDDSLKVDSNTSNLSDTTLVNTIKYTDDLKDTLDVLDVQLSEKKVLSSEDSLNQDLNNLSENNLKDLIDRVYDAKSIKKVSQDDKNIINFVHSSYSEQNTDNKFDLSLRQISNLYKIKNTLDLEDKVKELNLYIGKNNTFEDDSTQKVIATLDDIYSSHNSLNEIHKKPNLTKKVLEDTEDSLERLSKSTSNLLNKEYNYQDDTYAPGLGEKVKLSLEEDLTYGKEIISKIGNILDKDTKSKTESKWFNRFYKDSKKKNKDKTKKKNKKKNSFTNNYKNEFYVLGNINDDVYGLGYTRYLNKNIGIGLEVFERFSDQNKKTSSDVLESNNLSHLPGYGWQEVFRNTETNETKRTGVLAKLKFKLGRFGLSGGVGTHYITKTNLDTDGVAIYDNNGNIISQGSDPSELTNKKISSFAASLGADFDLTSKLSLGVNVQAGETGLDSYNLKAGYKFGKK